MSKEVDIDRKFNILAISRKSRKSYSESDAVLFLSKDKAFLNTLPHYYDECEKLGCGTDQLVAIRLLIARVRQYQLDHPEVAKIPDVDAKLEPECLKA